MGYKKARLCLLLGTALALCAAGAQTVPAPPQSAPNPKLLREYAKLQTQAASQQGAKQAETLARMAELDFDFAHAGYGADQPDTGEQHLDLAAQHADHACALLQAEAAQGNTKGMKDVEISLQKIVYGLGDLARQVHFRQRPKVEAVASHFADLRAQLLEWMFAPKPKKGA